MTVRQQIIDHIEKTGRFPNFASVGGHAAAQPVINEMVKDGTLVAETKLSPKGRKISGWALAK